MNELQSKPRDYFLQKNWYYHEYLANYYRFHIPEGKRVIEIGSGSGYILSKLNPSYGVGIDSNAEAIKYASEKYPNLKFINASADKIDLKETFDYIILSDTLTLLGDIQVVFKQIKNLCDSHTRLIINSSNFLWLPALSLAEILGLKSANPKDNWLDMEDIIGLLDLEGFQIITTEKKFIFPFYIPGISNFLNKYIANLPFFNIFALSNNVTARMLDARKNNEGSCTKTVSVIIPARNEKGNVEKAITRLPQMGQDMEIIFVEGGSTDGTYDEILKVKEIFPDKDIKVLRQSAKGKANAVWEGFDIAKNELLMILDGDLTVMPEELPKFYDAYCQGKGEFIYGSRLVYSMEKGAMQILNLFANKAFSLIFSWILNRRVKDTLCGTKVISRENYQKLKNLREYFGDFDPFGDFELLFGASKLDLKFVEIPIRYQARSYGSTNISRFKNGLELLKMTLFACRKIKFY